MDEIEIYQTMGELVWLGSFLGMILAMLWIVAKWK